MKKQIVIILGRQKISYGTLIELTMGHYGCKMSHRIFKGGPAALGHQLSETMNPAEQWISIKQEGCHAG
ncbi:MAG: hypothetical protein WAL98_18145 [Desulfatiglandaceae bacterium]|jgi:hypothetical protein